MCMKNVRTMEGTEIPYNYGVKKWENPKNKTMCNTPDNLKVTN